jgi:hypothetical protein
MPEEKSQESKQVRGPGVIDVLGRESEREMLERLACVVGSTYESSPIFVIGKKQDADNFVQRLRKHVYEPLKQGQIINFPSIVPDNPDDGANFEVEFTLGSEGNARKLAKALKNTPGPDGQLVKNVVMVYQDDEGQKFLPMLLDLCPDLTVWCLYMSEPGDELFEKRAIDAEGNPLPDGVDLDAEETDEDTGGVPSIPNEATYGKAGELASLLDCPKGFAYLSVLAAACGAGIEASSSIRPTLYVSLLGPVGCGKSVTRTRASELFFEPGDLKLEKKVPASDQGLYKILASADGQSRLLSQDEMRNMMSKAGIENSSLVPVLCDLFNENVAGGADKKTTYSINVKLSILGCVKIAHPAEFPEVFGFATAQGFYDRCLFGVEPREGWKFRDWSKPAFVFAPTKPSVSPDVFEDVNEWRDQDKAGRGRLGELVLRVAYVSAALNCDGYVSGESLAAAKKLVEWQEKVRVFYQAAKGANENQECVEAVLAAFRKSPGRSANWREISRNNHWHRRFPRTLTSVKKMLENQGVLVCDRASKKHYLNEGK